MSRDLDKLGLPPGFRLEKQSGNGHFYVLDPEGEKLRLPNGMPCQVSYSPSDYRSRRHEAARIRKALQAREERA